MKRLFFAALVLLASATLALAYPPGFRDGRNQGVKPVWTGGILSFNLRNGDCQKRTYGDGRGESDCKNGNSRSQINSKDRQRMGRSYEYAFEFRVAPGFRYDGRGWGKVNYRSRLLIAEWQRINTIKNHMYEMHLDSRRGVTFEDKTCVSPNRLSDWNAVRVRVFWSDKADGQLQVICNGRAVYSLRGPNMIPPDCGEDWKLQCKPELQKLREPIQWQVGPHLRGHGQDWRKLGFPSVFPPFPETGVQIEMRNLYYGPLRN